MFIPVEYLNKAIEVAKDMIEKGQENEAMPKEFIPPIFNTPVTAYRWHSLAAKRYVSPRSDREYELSSIAAETMIISRPTFPTRRSLHRLAGLTSLCLSCRLERTRWCHRLWTKRRCWEDGPHPASQGLPVSCLGLSRALITA